ncbi:hypothetical protein ACVGWU_00555, partial [Enterobacter intestinihominis]
PPPPPPRPVFLTGDAGKHVFFLRMVGWFIFIIDWYTGIKYMFDVVMEHICVYNKFVFRGEFWGI